MAVSNGGFHNCPTMRSPRGLSRRAAGRRASRSRLTAERVCQHFIASGRRTTPRTRPAGEDAAPARVPQRPPLEPRVRPQASVRVLGGAGRGRATGPDGVATPLRRGRARRVRVAGSSAARARAWTRPRSPLRHAVPGAASSPAGGRADTPAPRPRARTRRGQGPPLAAVAPPPAPRALRRHQQGAPIRSLAPPRHSRPRGPGQTAQPAHRGAVTWPSCRCRTW